MSAHTPGPWQVKSEYEPEYIVGDIDGPDDGSYYYRPVAMVSETDDFEANARLIAAAPDLLAALSRLCRSMPTDSDMREAGWEGCEIDEACNAYDAARAAIAKATGEAA